MRNSLKFILLFSISIIRIGIMFNTDECFAASQTSYAIPRHIEYSFELQNTTNNVLKEAEFWTYAPVKQTATQQRIHIEASHPFKELSDKAGNSILHFTLLDIPPYATKIITIRADLVLSDTPVPIAARSAKASLQDLQPEPYCESDDPDIIQLAKQLTADDSLSTVKNFVNWVTQNVTYSGYLKNPRGARYALKHKQGDCTEFMYLFVALCRAAGIPARGVGGYVYAQNAILRPGDYHNWAEFSVDGVWHVADPQHNIFMQNQSHYLVMRVIGDVSDDHPMQHYRRFRYTGEGLKVRMN